MRKPITACFITAFFTVLSLTIPLRADEPRHRPADPAPRGGNDRLLTEPPSPFESPPSPFDLDLRPPAARPEPLYPSVEREVDRGSGRIESDAEFESRRAQRKQDERRGVLRERREFERFDEERDRNLRLETVERRAAVDGRAQQWVESESQRLAADRERFYRSAGIDVAGAAHDTRQLKNLERAYQHDVKQLKRERAAALKRLAKQDLTAEGRATARAAIEGRFGAAQRQRRERYTLDRAHVLGSE